MYINFSYIFTSRFSYVAEYCASRAVPTVSNSEYLNTIGVKLLPDIDIMWTGPMVISKRITVKHIEELSAVLRRPPVIWDNIHANDYDRKRVFLGPFDGRAPELIPHVRGVLTNPNCQFEANYIPMHTLAQWSRTNLDLSPSHGSLPGNYAYVSSILLAEPGVASDMVFVVMEWWKESWGRGQNFWIPKSRICVSIL